MTKDTFILSVLLVAAVAALIRQRIAFPDDRVTAYALLAAVVLLAVAAGRSTRSTIGTKGIVRQPPVRVSEPSQQGDIQPSTVVMADSIYWAAYDKVKKQYRVYRYERAPKVVGDTPRSVPVGNTTFSAPITALLVRNAKKPRMFVGCKDGTIVSYSNPATLTPLSYGPVPPLTNGDALDSITSIAEGTDSAYLLGKASGKAKIGRVTEDGTSYSLLTGVDLADKEVGLFRVDKITKTIAATYSSGEVKGIVAWRDVNGAWTKILNKEEKGASILDVKICRGRVLFLFAQEAMSPRLWSSDELNGKDLGIDQASHLAADDDYAFVAGTASSTLKVFQLEPAGDPVELSFGGAGAPTEIYDLVRTASALKVLTKHGKTTLWTLNGQTFGSDGEFKNATKPRNLSPDGAAFFEGANTLYAHENEINLSMVDTSYPINILLNAGLDCVFVAKDNHAANPHVTVFSSYMGQVADK